MEENWYIVLELEFAPHPVVDEQLIEERIEEKRKLWARKANDFNHGAEYRKYMQMIPTIRKEMVGENNIRQKLIQDACRKMYEPIDEIFSQIAKKEIRYEVIKNIAKKQNVSEELVKGRAIVKGIQIIADNEVDYQQLYTQYYQKKPENADKYNGMNHFLDSFHAESLYDFLYPDEKLESECQKPCESLRAQAENKKKNEFYKNDSVSGVGSKLCSYCEEIFENVETKKQYDIYLRYVRGKKVLDGIKDIFEMTGEIGIETLRKCVGQLEIVFGNRNLAEQVLTAFCRIEKLPIPIIVDINNSEETKKNTEAKQSKVNTATQHTTAYQAKNYGTSTSQTRQEHTYYANRNTNNNTFSFGKLLKWGVICFAIVKIVGWISSGKDEPSDMNMNSEVVNEATVPTIGTATEAPTYVSSQPYKLNETNMQEGVRLFFENGFLWKSSKEQGIITKELEEQLVARDNWENGGIFEKEEAEVFRSVCEEYAMKCEYQLMKYNIEDGLGEVEICLYYTDFSHVIALADWYAVEVSEMEGDLEEKWNSIYYEAVKRAAEELKNQSEITTVIYFTEQNQSSIICGGEDLDVLYDAMTGCYRNEVDYDWVDTYMQEK